MSLSRRQLLSLSGGVVAGVGLSACGLGLTSPGGSTGALLRSRVPLPSPFAAELPPLTRLTPHDGRATVTARRRSVEILPGRMTEILGYDGRFPGPTIEATKGEPLHLRVRNAVDHAVVNHLHGGVTPAEHDGYPTDLVRPGASRVHEYPLDQRAATLWYHDHTMDLTGPNVYAGMAGAFVLRDPAEDDLGLPDGDRELTLVLTDRSFGEDAELVYPVSEGTFDRRFHGGLLGDCMLVNGAPWPRTDVDAARYRVRILNACNARRLELALDPGGDLVQVGTDQGLLTRPHRRSTLTLAPAERADLVIDFAEHAPGSPVTLVNRLGEGDMGLVMRFDVARRATDDSRVPDRLSTIDPIDPSRVVRTRDFHLALGQPVRGGHGSHSGGTRSLPMWSINGRPYRPGHDLFRAELGTVERWRFTTDVHHPVHAHLVPFQVEQDGAPAWKDTVDIGPASRAEVLVPIEGYRGRYVLHCHNLEHEDRMMMADWSVV
ncbi:multicopper oxidase family protein [Janibacter cremeus]|uniref:multicopper oxidase family protein n=1 Tax=Janibacter cremeus TaxID=1285192 RepID=UPI0023F74B98|nr:multicopper oxidase family protein [Janibacter cremeus]WEV77308.1 multicopper oxidase family protein [Janibacter cremeus]